MTQATTAAPLTARKTAAPSNVYTVLMAAATVAMLGGLLAVSYFNMRLTGSGNPLKVVNPQDQTDVQNLLQEAK